MRGMCVMYLSDAKSMILAPSPKREGEEGQLLFEVITIHKDYPPVLTRMFFSEGGIYIYNEGVLTNE